MEVIRDNISPFITRPYYWKNIAIGGNRVRKLDYYSNDNWNICRYLNYNYRNYHFLKRLLNDHVYFEKYYNVIDLIYPIIENNEHFIEIYLEELINIDYNNITKNIELRDKIITKEYLRDLESFKSINPQDKKKYKISVLDLSISGTRYLFSPGHGLPRVLETASRIARSNGTGGAGTLEVRVDFKVLANALTGRART